MSMVPKMFAICQRLGTIVCRITRSFFSFPGRKQISVNFEISLSIVKQYVFWSSQKVQGFRLSYIDELNENAFDAQFEDSPIFRR